MLDVRYGKHADGSRTLSSLNLINLQYADHDLVLAENALQVCAPDAPFAAAQCLT